jgi:hypothetical protein
VAETSHERDASGRQAASAVHEVRVCDRCQRPLLAKDRQEYTDQRALLVAERGLCVCPEKTSRRPPKRAKAGPAASAKASA